MIRHKARAANEAREHDAASIDRHALLSSLPKQLAIKLTAPEFSEHCAGRLAGLR